MAYLKQQTKLVIGELLIEFARIEQQIEVIRELLCEQTTFHPYIAFKYIDRLELNAKGFISPQDIQKFLALNGFTHEIQKCQMFVYNYDQDNDGGLSFSEFLRILLPLKNQQLRQNISLKAPPTDAKLDPKCEYTLAKLIDNEIRDCLEADIVKQQLQACYDYTPSLCFQELDKTNSGKIILKDLEQFFFDNAILIYNDELVAMFKRIDLKNDGFIDQEEFFRALNQHSKPQKDAHYHSPTKTVSYLQRYLQPNFSPQKTATFHKNSISIDDKPVEAQSVYYYQTPQKSQNNAINSKKQSQEKLSQSRNDVLSHSRKNKTYNFDDTMTNIITQSKANYNTKLIKSFDSPGQRNTSKVDQSFQLVKSTTRAGVHKTPQKYLDQKTELRAQLEFSKLTSQKKYSLGQRTLSLTKTKIKPLANTVGVTVTPKKNQIATKTSTLKQFKEVLLRILDQQLNMRKIREKITNFTYLNTREAFQVFQMIDEQTQDGFITHEDIQAFLFGHSINFNIKDIDQLIKNLDTDLDGKISLDDLRKSLEI